MERKHQHLSLIVSIVLFVVLAGIAFWQTSLNTDNFRPTGATETVVLWAMSTLVVLGVFTLGFIVFRSLLKLYIDRRRNRLGSKIKTKLVAGALVLSLVPVICLVLFSFTFLNRTLDKWFMQPTVRTLKNSEAVSDAIHEVMRHKTETEAAWIAALPQVAAYFQGESEEAAIREALRELASVVQVQYIGLLPAEGKQPMLEISVGDVIRGPVEWRLPENEAAEQEAGAAEPERPAGVLSAVTENSDYVYAAAPVEIDGAAIGRVVVAWQIPQDVLARRAEMRRHAQQYAAMQADYREYRYFYLNMLALITVFVLFVAVWLALFLSKQIVTPIEALVEATGELSSGHLDYRIQTPAIDELAALVHSFNQMTQQLEAKTLELQKSNAELARANGELEARRRFINAILESITPGVISVSEKGEILKVNSSVSKIFSAEAVEAARTLTGLFSGEQLEEIQYLIKRARRIGVASRELEIRHEGRILHIAATVSAIGRDGEPAAAEARRFVVVLEDTTELLQAQKAAAWNEVARRVAHEIKNPLTPIALSAERMSRLAERINEASKPAEKRRLRESFDACMKTIAREIETLRTLVNEFAHYARMPAPQPQRCGLNGVVLAAVDVFQGRLDGVTVRTQLGENLPDAWIDPEQLKRAVVNLIDNAAEALQKSWVREIEITTGPGALPDTVEVAVADSGPGVSPEDKEKLFLPYFSTKRRGTGLGLAIVNRIVSDHNGSIRIEDNRPSGSRFVLEVPVAEAVAPVGVGA